MICVRVIFLIFSFKSISFYSIFKKLISKKYLINETYSVLKTCGKLFEIFRDIFLAAMKNNEGKDNFRYILTAT